jgi:hypothetical protein
MHSTFASRAVIAAALMALVPSSVMGVDGVVLIDQNRALAGGVTPGDAPGFPVTISRSGSYRLSGNLDAPASTDAIQILAARVTLDLNGFSVRLTGDPGFSAGIQGFSNHVAVTNGFVEGFSTAVALTGDSARVERVHAINNSSFGIIAGPSSIVRGNVARGNHIGIEVRGKSVVADNVVTDNENFGMTVSGQAGVPGGATITNNTVSSNGNIGLQVVCPSVLIGNTVVHNVSQNLMLINSASCVSVNNVAP